MKSNPSYCLMKTLLGALIVLSGCSEKPSDSIDLKNQILNNSYFVERINHIKEVDSTFELEVHLVEHEIIPEPTYARYTPYVFGPLEGNPSDRELIIWVALRDTSFLLGWPRFTQSHISTGVSRKEWQRWNRTICLNLGLYFTKAFQANHATEFNCSDVVQFLTRDPIFKMIVTDGRPLNESNYKAIIEEEYKHGFQADSCVVEEDRVLRSLQSNFRARAMEDHLVYLDYGHILTFSINCSIDPSVSVYYFRLNCIPIFVSRSH